MRFFFVVCGFGLAVAMVNVLAPILQPPTVPGNSAYTLATDPVSFRTEPVVNRVARVVEPNRNQSMLVSNEKSTATVSQVFNVSYSTTQQGTLPGFIYQGDTSND